MKCRLKRLAVLFSVTIMFSPTGSSYVFASESVGTNNEVAVEVNLEKDDLDTVLTEREEFVEEFKDLLLLEDNISIDSAVDGAKETAPQDTITDSIESEIELVKNEEPTIFEISLETNVPVETYEITENISVTFDTNLIIVDEFQESEEQEAPTMIEEDELAFSPLKFIDSLIFKEALAAPKSRIKNASHTRHIYDVTAKKWKIVTAYISSEFTYNGIKVTARRTGNYMKSNGIAGTFIKISGTSSAVQKPSSKRRVAYQSGVAKIGITIKGVSVVWDTKYLRVNVEANHNGTISKSSVLR
ncbi:hypothetical protein I6N95_07980 [Vagococcus sp. BWB3-3]|uniref:DUF5626 domain-containing protein n=1 Tax=Vagococcus allomyrinae TaxID=2794353 RepID=A0A940P4L3_9ENTE|nr:hypothetical protein [Vagococcus allomyrinae]MBP1040940.1 hypothetical protein [Vagococcus allomyrinae]